MILFAVQYKLDLNQYLIVDSLMFLRISIFLVMFSNNNVKPHQGLLYRDNISFQPPKTPQKATLVSDEK